MRDKALVVGAGRIGAGFAWDDDAYTHAGAYKALKDRVSLEAFVEPDAARASAAEKKWRVTAFESLEEALKVVEPTVVSVCTQPEEQIRVLPIIEAAPSVRGIWCEKPYMGYPAKKPVQVNYIRRADYFHRDLARQSSGGSLIVYGKDDLTTRCHFDDLAAFWKAELDYRPYQGPCAYLYERKGHIEWFDNGGVEGGKCMKNMLSNLLDHLDSGIPLWSPADAA